VEFPSAQDFGRELEVVPVVKERQPNEHPDVAQMLELAVDAAQRKP
jgi:hypothetical protein